MEESYEGFKYPNHLKYVYPLSIIILSFKEGDFIYNQDRLNIYKRLPTHGGIIL